MNRSWHVISAWRARYASSGCATAVAASTAATCDSSSQPIASSIASPKRSTGTASAAGRSSCTVSCSAPHASLTSRTFDTRSLNVASRATVLLPHQLFEKVLGDDTRPRQPSIERDARRADEKPLRDDARIDAGGNPLRRLLDHRLVLRLELDYLREALVAERGERLEAHRLDGNGARIGKRIENRVGDVAGSRIRITARPRAPVRSRFLLEAHTAEQLHADERAQVRSRMRNASAEREDERRLTAD